MSLDRMEEIYDLRLDLPQAKSATVRRYSPKRYRSANWKADDRRIMLAIGAAVLAIGFLLLLASAIYA